MLLATIVKSWSVDTELAMCLVIASQDGLSMRQQATQKTEFYRH